MKKSQHKSPLIFFYTVPPFSGLARPIKRILRFKKRNTLIRVELKGDSAEETERLKWDKRIREVEQGPEGALYVLEDGSGGRLLKLIPSR